MTGAALDPIDQGDPHGRNEAGERRDPYDPLDPSVAAPPGIAAVARATDLTGVLVLKHDSLFLLTDSFGDVHPDSRGLGLYAGDTRVLSHYELRINGARPVVLRAGSAASYGSTIQLTNPDFLRDPGDKVDPEVVLRRQSLGVVRERLVSEGFGERIRIDNFTTHPERCSLTLRMDADFADIFEVRGVIRPERGRRTADTAQGDSVAFSYLGLDGRRRRTRLRFSEPIRVVPASMSVQEVDACLRGDGTWPEVKPTPDAAGQVLLVFDWTLAPGGHRVLDVTVRTESEDEAASRAVDHGPRPVLGEAAEAAHRAWSSGSAAVSTPHVFADRAFRRALSDLRLLVNSGPGPDERYVAAGVPWFSCLFGRDAIITALQLLTVRPQVAREALSVLARLQATEIDDWRDAQPGKILHELRTGELAAAGEIPHTPYYGSVDSTPLWLMLLGAYQRWTGDDALVDRLWPNALAAMAWIESYGDMDGDGFVEYQRHSSRGLINQGWKDSADANRHRDGTLAQAPLALVEVQAYVYRARRELARLARSRGESDLAHRQDRAATELAAAIESRFWMEDAGTYAMALDAGKEQVDAVASNAGHVLWCGAASPAHARRVAESLLGPGLWSGWGIRTLSAEMAGYNPIGYHLGTVWPHDNAIAAAGLFRYGLNAEAARVTGAMIEATVYFRDSRLPELFCGFDRTRSAYPVPYPVACSPQAWAAGSLFHLLGSMLGLEPDANKGELVLHAPTLPDYLPEVRLENLRVGETVVDLLIKRSDGSAGVEVLHRTGDLSVVVRL
ncbi:MAG: amylo-alpha-1,6-glucosidase [Chloroflexi bacterium]|nr:amylo-alpha-1,6-glucosidase [Chloroflexota bacterium]MDQ3408178.1 amylo-alpha-1,6-glucosidase [Chloroflexota bacterium]